jgi:serine/threonine-protein kinase RsbW
LADGGVVTRGEKTPPGDPLNPEDVERRQMALRYRATIESTRDAIGAAADEILEVARRIGCDDDEITDISIALREALANAIIHGNENDPGKRVLVRCYTHDELGMLVAIRDEGKGFDPDEVPDPRNAERIHLHHGRGVFMMRELMDRVMHRKGGREVVLYKKRKNGNSDDSGPTS